MAKAIEFIIKEKRSEEVLSLPQISWPLYRQCHDLKEQIEELIQRGKLQKFVKKYYHYRLKSEDKYNEDHKEDKRDRPKATTREIRMIIEGSVM